MERPDLAGFPRSPGVYQFADSSGVVVYVGKALSLHDRVSSYFSSATLHPRTSAMLAAASTVTFAVCSSEREALLLERELISSLQPRFNVRLRHGNGYPGLHLTRDDAPRVSTWRGTPPRGGEAFGPFPGVGAAALLDAVTGAFGVRSCRDREFRAATNAQAPCLLGETGRCVAPCLGESRRAQHDEAVAGLRAYLAGRDPSVLDALADATARHAAQENFEAAGVAHARRQSLETLSQVQAVDSAVSWDGVVASLRRDGRTACLALVTVTAGRISGVRLLQVDDDPDLPDSDLRDQLAGQAGVDPATPPGGGRRAFYGRLVEFADRQAEAGLSQAASSPWSHGIGRDDAARELADALGMAAAPRTIEAIDVSHLGGRHPFASVVTLVDGMPATRLYRKIRVPDGGDDYAAVTAAVTARLHGRRLGLPELPDLLVIDGGPEQLACAVAVAQGVPDAGAVTIVGLAKRLEEVWTPGEGDPVILPRSSEALRLLQVARDEAHRTAVARHRVSRDAAALTTVVDGLPGVGPARRRKLLAAFGSPSAVAAASARDLQAVVGEAVGLRIWQALHPAAPQAAD